MAVGVIAEFVLDEKCVSQQHPWSVFDASTANGQLAGVLAGFMLISITTLLTVWRDDLESAESAVVYLGLGVIVLGLDAYLFGSVAAIKPPQGSHDFQQVCAKAWVEYMPGVGLMGVGAGLLVAGLAWIIARHEWAGDSTKFTVRVTLAALFVVIGPLALLTWHSINFIDEMHGELAEVDTTTQDFGSAVVGIFFVACIVTVLWVLVRIALGGQSPVNPQWARIMISAGVAIYLAEALAFTVLYPWLQSAPPVFFFGAGIFLCIVAPSIIFVLVALAMPGRRCENTSAQQEAGRDVAA
ncbi:hypothetical protein AWC05_25010 [Mycobacterium florentinum]|uniref:Uncharacterized protein n=1 Tax=Mycobacterium florentinum TaxID=292462 RepID=A0A1X1U7B7_MYCFL|nr:hypothetical protein [Mycobacterium florentinum]MCV7409589.1 hypothetical protein [Mycobacterium florentinum]ORV52731.1 hypothetical protein AWC05_25010 [Mycobacterium florentinum]BBX78883.1 hypothetical protein MFLOJ_26700 [Mycobacterium florentinum]